MCPQPPDWASTNRNCASLYLNPVTSQIRSVMLSLQSPVSCRTTFPSTKSSARISAILQLPPIKNLKVCPPMTKLGDVSVPWGPSPCVPPAGWEGLGRSSKPPIHQSPLCLDGWPRFRAVGLSPYVGWLLNAVPVLIQPDKPFSKSNRVQPIKNQIKRLVFFRIPQQKIALDIDTVTDTRERGRDLSFIPYRLFNMVATVCKYTAFTLQRPLHA